MIKEFKEFAFKGNMIDMAVGIIIGAAFGTVIKSLVDNVFMPPLGMLLGKVDFSKMKITLQEAVVTDGKVVTEEVAVGYGQFITDLLSFLLVALAVFLVIKKVVAGMKKKEEPSEEAPPEPPKQEVLLEEIRDLLKEKV